MNKVQKFKVNDLTHVTIAAYDLPTKIVRSDHNHEEKFSECVALWGEPEQAVHGTKGK